MNQDQTETPAEHPRRIGPLTYANIMQNLPKYPTPHIGPSSQNRSSTRLTPPRKPYSSHSDRRSRDSKPPPSPSQPNDPDMKSKYQDLHHQNTESEKRELERNIDRFMKLYTKEDKKEISE
ncbi:hypothetical protein E4U60_000920 [Claviceps pazoutovae]|uniref:Uncharacterized protein n=1 Tax=Claviceps pazoutovae TaxID=1649127 RepID=A0A9P7ME31_9HYPO|nr:hypothetical protein E4U60_000920 [Claviceps pazoutovae]